MDEARRCFAADIKLHEALGDGDRAAVERFNYAELEFAAGDARRALELIDEGFAALACSELETTLNNDVVTVSAYLNACAYRLVLGEIGPALGAARSALGRAQRVQSPVYVAVALQHLATIAALTQAHTAAARLCGFVDEAYRREGVRREPTEQRTYDMLIRALHEHLDEPELERQLANGSGMSEDEAIALSRTIGQSSAIAVG